MEFSSLCFFFSSRRRHTRWTGDWSSDVCSSDLSGCSVIRAGTYDSHDRDLDVVDRGQRIEQAVPLLTALPPDPELTGRRPEIERGGLEPVDVHRDRKSVV